MWEGRNPETFVEGQTKSLIALSDHEHAHRRRSWNRAFSTTALKGYEEIMETRVSQLVRELSTQQSHGPVDLAMWMSSFSYDFMSDMA